MRRNLLTITFLFLSPAFVYALGLGDIVANSTLNEPLEGRIELLSPLPDELDSLKISLADSNAFAKAGVDRPSILGKLKFTLQRSLDGEPDYIRVSSQLPVQEPFLNFLVEVTWSNGRILREYTILLDPPSYDFRSRIERTVEPEGIATNTIQDAVSADTSQQPEVSTYLPVTNFTGSDYGPTSRLDTLSEIADKTRPDKSINLNKMMMAIFRANPEAFINQNINGLKGGYVLRIPDETMINELTSTEALNKVRSHHAAWGDTIYTEDTTAQEQPQPIAEVVSEEEKIVDTSEVDVVDPELRLVVADDGTEATQETGSTEPSKSDDLLVAEETIETLTQENFELKARLKELETLVEQLQPLLSLKDDELAAYQDQLAIKADRTAIEEESESSKVIADALEDVLAEVDADFEEEDAIEEVDAGFEEEDAIEEVDAGFEEEDAIEEITERPSNSDQYVESVERDAALVQEALSPFESIIDKTKNILMSKFGLAVLGLLVLLLVLLRFRKEPVETVHIEPIDDAELAEINKEVTDLMDDAAATHSPERVSGSEDETIIAKQETELAGENLSKEEETEFSMDEVNTYLAFEQFEDAEKAVRTAIDNDPNNSELHMKLLEVFYNSGNKADYQKTATIVNKKFSDSGDVLDKTKTMWQEMTESPLLISDDGSEDDGSEDETIVVGAPDDGSEDETIVVGAPDDGSEDETIVVGAPDDNSNIDIGAPAEEEKESDIEINQPDDFEIDLSIGEDDNLVNTDAIIDEDEISDDFEKTEFNLEIDDLDDGADDNETSLIEEENKEDNDQEVDLVLDNEINLEIDDLDDGVSNKSSQEDTHAAFVEKVAESEDLSTEDVVATKLDLAKAYVEVSDKENAKTILDEVLVEGDEEQRKQAQILLDQI